MKKFDSLSEREILALAISLEEEDERVYADFAEGLRESFPASAAVFEAMRADETGHRQRLLSLYQKQFGDHIPLIRRQDVRGFVHRMPVWLVRPLGLDAVRKQASAIEFETRRFYERAASRAKDVNVRQLLDDLAEEERGHEGRAQELTEQNLPPDFRGQVLLGEFLGATFVTTFLFGQVIEQLPNIHVLRSAGSSLVETTRLEFNRAGLFTHRVQPKRAHQPYGHAMHKAPHILPPDERNVISELFLIQGKKPLPVTCFIGSHGFKYCRRGGETLPQSFCEIGINPLILLFKRNGER